MLFGDQPLFHDLNDNDGNEENEEEKEGRKFF